LRHTGDGAPPIVVRAAPGAFRTSWLAHLVPRALQW